MKYTLLLLFMTCISNASIAQAESEYMSMFSWDMTKILFSVDKKKTPKLTFNAKIYLENKDKLFRKIKVEYTFLNDSILKQRLDGQTFYGLMKNGEVLEYDINQKKIVDHFNSTVRDSSGYELISYNTIYNHTDTTKHYIINKKNNAGKLIGSVSTRIEDGGQEINKTVWNNEGDTLYKTSYYTLRGSEWLLVSESLHHKKMSTDLKTCTELITNTREKEFMSEKIDLNYHYTISSFYTFDEQGRIIEIEKYEYLTDTKNWDEKDVITISYK